MQQLLLALAAHFVGDFDFQGKWMAEKKGKSLEVNFYHVATYTAVFVLINIGLSLLSLGIIFVTHFIIDLLKERWRIVKYTWLDQLLHIAVIGFVLLVTK